MKNLFTSESVSEGHPDKLSDQISDSLLDNILAFDKNSKVAIETFVTTDRVIVGGEIKTKAVIDYEKIIRNIIKFPNYRLIQGVTSVNKKPFRTIFFNKSFYTMIRVGS